LLPPDSKARSNLGWLNRAIGIWFLVASSRVGSGIIYHARRASSRVVARATRFDSIVIRAMPPFDGHDRDDMIAFHDRFRA